jgi:uncharacterized repeat protein (TIGR01451 family)
MGRRGVVAEQSFALEKKTGWSHSMMIGNRNNLIPHRAVSPNAGWARHLLQTVLLGFVFLICGAPASAQFKITQTFTQTTAPGWTLADSAILTAPSIDAAGSGWLRLTGAVNTEQGNARFTGGSFLPNQSVVIKFNYVSWGGTGADGISVFFYDSTQDMSGALTGGGLGYCGGAGGYLAIGLDEFGNFSNPGDKCGSASGGPGAESERLVIRGPLSQSNPFVTNIAVPGGIDNPGVSTRPSPKVVLLTMTPATVGFNITAQFQSASNLPFQMLFSNVNFPYVAPASLSVGFSSSTGGSTNNHEIQGLSVSTPDDLAVTMTGPAQIAPGNTITYTVVVTNDGAYAIDAADAPTVTDTLPASLTGVSWTCSGSGGATCAASGSGNINTSTLTLPINGAATYAVTGTVPGTTACNSTLTNSANADFGATSNFTDNNPGNNTASVTTTINCAAAVLANPTSISFGAQTLGTPSTAMPITLSGTGGASVTNISTSGDYTQTNNCTAPLSGSTSCTINVVFTPSAEGTRNGTVTITSSASPVTIALTGTGTSAVPNAFSFMALTAVDPSSVQTSNAITVTGTNVASPINITGGEYSINGGPFTAAAGTVSPGAQVRVQLTASAAVSTATQATLVIDGVASPFSVTTRAADPGQLDFGASTFTGSGASSTATVTVTRTGGTDGPLSAEVVDAAGTVLGTVTFAAGVGGTQTVTLMLTNVTAGGNLDLHFAKLTGGGTTGTAATAALNVAPAPLGTVTVTSGGGALSPVMLIALALLAGLRMLRTQPIALKSRHWPMMIVVAAVVLGSGGARAADGGDFLSNTYFGVRAGEATSTLGGGDLTTRLDANGYDVQAHVDRNSGTVTAYGGYDLRKNLSLELAWTYVGWTRATLTGTTPANLNSLLSDTADIARGSGDALSLALRYRLPLGPRIGLDLRGGLYGWSTQSDGWVGAVREFQGRDHGLGYTIGAGPHFMLTQRIGAGLSVDYFGSTSENRFFQETAALDYHF